MKKTILCMSLLLTVLLLLSSCGKMKTVPSLTADQPQGTDADGITLTTQFPVYSPDCEYVSVILSNNSGDRVEFGSSWLLEREEKDEWRMVPFKEGSKMKTCQFTDAPVMICGLNHIDPEKKEFWRLSDEDGAAVSDGIRGRSKTTAGARVRFRTNTRTLKLKMTLHTLGVDPCIPICGSGGADVMRGTAENTVYMGLINPWSYDNKSPESVFHLDGTMQQITVNLPRNERVAGLEISVDDDAELLEPAPFTRPGKLCFYGSSITEGGCCTRTGNAYTAAVSRWLDMDYINYGFSGLARGEDAMADVIARDDYAALIYDYDHNAPDAAHLEKTHERFFRRIREARPELPILIMTKPDFDSDPVGNAKRREVIYRTYLNARAAGDRKVWFLDGEQLFGTFGREMCSVDNCHPNDLGFYRMAEKVYAMLLKML